MPGAICRGEIYQYKLHDTQPVMETYKAAVCRRDVVFEPAGKYSRRAAEHDFHYRPHFLMSSSLEKLS